MTSHQDVSFSLNITGEINLKIVLIFSFIANHKKSATNNIQKDDLSSLYHLT